MRIVVNAQRQSTPGSACGVWVVVPAGSPPFRVDCAAEQIGCRADFIASRILSSRVSGVAERSSSRRVSIRPSRCQVKSSQVTSRVHVQ